ncbi:MAG: restriction endonuclease, partial [Chitinophagaceae bacterium]|nr:restriction endonuclease [Chitinophagaceae bacterium]
VAVQQEIVEVAEENRIETTAEELEAYQIVKAMLRQKIKASRIVHRDAQSYFAILLDDNNRKPICRLYLNGSKRYIGIFDEQKKETKIEILTVDDIFLHGEAMGKTVEGYDKSLTESSL